METNERRSYQRDEINCDASVSADKENWAAVFVSDLSSSGLQMRVDREFDVGAALWFNVTLYGFSSEFEVMAQGVVRRKRHVKHYYIYGVSFRGLPIDAKIRIDEMIAYMRRNAKPDGRSDY
jgi:N-methylhydantoinase A/oxoprolinase/acetone carboxylase beta subunit